MDNLYILNSIHSKFLRMEFPRYGQCSFFYLSIYGIGLWIRPPRKNGFIDYLRGRYQVYEQFNLESFNVESIRKLLKKHYTKELKVLNG